MCPPGDEAMVFIIFVIGFSLETMSVVFSGLIDTSGGISSELSISIVCLHVFAGCFALIGELASMVLIDRLFYLGLSSSESLVGVALFSQSK